ncbi:MULTISPECIES: VOC family protein [unclassified Caulobacter]|uniref:VOC family protein n=1 Tax=unclassified Caulobacter TaxID=2648921 RepID=UPI000D3ABA92|nr:MULTISPECIES: VOC family protein [unclassified Caulobacter]PTS82599.1 glyoxalase family protein [Caulobacter sp. HMWF009]PTT12270.1 glyoxalase family protein [Caulobacter sp. HMWF025]
MRADGKIDYIEWPSSDLPGTKAFYQAAFGWTFADYGPDYVAFQDQGTHGGFFTPETAPPPKPLVILYAHDLEAMEARVVAAGGVISTPIFSFPGGRRFHFMDPGGNELAVWTETP